MQAAKLTKLDMAKKMATSRSQRDRVLSSCADLARLTAPLASRRIGDELYTKT